MSRADLIHYELDGTPLDANGHSSFYRGIYAAQNARLQSEAMRFNTPINFPNDDELAYHLKGFMSGDYSRPWNLWKEEARRACR